jgi:hypothetical protein
MCKDAELPGTSAGIDPDVDRAPHARYGRFALWVVSASSMAIGVAGTVAYGMWFDRDEHTYVDAIAGARQALGPGVQTPSRETSVWTGQVSPAKTPPVSDTARANMGFAQQPPPVRPGSRAVYSRGAEPSRVAAGCPDRVQRPAAQIRSNSTSQSKPSRGPFARIASFFHHASYRRHVSPAQRDSFARP